MKNKFNDTVDELEKLIQDLKSKGISIDSIDTSLKELKKHNKNIIAIEKNIDAIRDEVIDRIKDELDENKRAGKFSIFGFYIGAIALVLSIISSLYTISNKSNSKQILKPVMVDNKLERIDERVENLTYNIIGFDDFNIPLKKNEFKISSSYDGRFKEQILLSKDSIPISISVPETREIKLENEIIPTASVCFYVKNKKLGLKGIQKFVQINNDKDSFWYNEKYYAIIVKEKDTLKFANLNLYVKRIYRTNSKLLVVADKNNAVLFERINISNDE